MEMIDSDIAYVTGNPASGKTVLGYLLDGHPSTAVTHFHDSLLATFNDIESIDEFFHDDWQNDRNDRLDLVQFRAHLPKSYYSMQRITEGTEREEIASRTDSHSFNREFDFYKFEKSLFDDLMKQNIESAEDILQLIYHNYFDSMGNINYNADKNKYFIGRGSKWPPQWRFFLENFKNPKIININRDPRSITATEDELENSDGIRQGRLFEHQRVNKKAREFEEKYENFIVVEFEDMILDTERVVDRIYEFLDIQQTDILYRPTMGGQSFQTDKPILGEVNDHYTKIASRENQRLLDLQYNGLFHRDVVNYDGGEIYTYMSAYLRWKYRADILPGIRKIGKSILT